MYDYLVWFKLKGQQDQIRGMARNWKRAEQMAQQLHFVLSIELGSGIETGITKVEHGQLYSNNQGCLRCPIIHPEEKNKRILQKSLKLQN